MAISIQVTLLFCTDHHTYHIDNPKGPFSHNIIMQASSFTMISHYTEFISNFCLRQCPGTGWRDYTLTHTSANTQGIIAKYGISLSFMITGHTKSAPDWCLGLLKRKYKATYISSLLDIKRVVEECSTVNHHFLFDSSSTGSVITKSCLTADEERCDILRDHDWHPTHSSLPDVLSPSGLSLERQKYLYEKICDFCTPDVVCPKPVEDLEREMYHHHQRLGESEGVLGSFNLFSCIPHLVWGPAFLFPNWSGKLQFILFYSLAGYGEL